MPVACSFCHQRFDVPVDDEGRQGSHFICPRCVCPRCKSEVGIEPVAPPPKPMKLFGAILATAGFLVVVISGVVVMAG